MPFPAPFDHYPTKDEVADYLAAYAGRFSLDVRPGCDVTSMRRVGGRFLLRASHGEISASAVIVATGQGAPNVPVFGSRLSRRIPQVHSSAYRNPLQLPAGRTLVVGCGNSGAQIAEELCHSRSVALSVGRMPRCFPQRLLGRDIFWWLILAGMMDVKSEGRARLEAETMPLIGGALKTLVKRGRIERLARVVGVDGDSIAFADGTQRSFDVVIWATGFRNDFRWIAIDGAIDIDGTPMHARGVSSVPGLYFVGLPWLTSKGSGFLGFVGRDALALARIIADRNK